MNLFEVLRESAARRPGHAAVVDCDDGHVCTYAELIDRIARTAACLARGGLRSGDVVGLHCSNGLPYIVLAYAVWKLGGTLVPLAPELAPGDKVAISRDLGLSGVIVGPPQAAWTMSLSKTGGMSLPDGEMFIRLATAREHPSGFQALNAAFIRFTSGTTAEAKGVILSHETVYARIHATNEGLHIADTDRVLPLLSMSYHFTASIVGYLTFGATLLQSRSYFGSAIVRAAATHRATVIFGSPLHFRLMSAVRTGAHLPALRAAISTGSSSTPALAAAFWSRFHLPLSDAYGIIEVGIPCINLQTRLEKVGSVGRPSPDYEIRLRDVGPDSTGTIEIRGKGLLDGYYLPWRRRDEVLSDGWFATGDLGRLDEDGYLYVEGREKDVINVAGMKVFPREIETILESHPAVEEAYVFGESHASLGEIPVARVVLRRAASVPEVELREHCRQRLAAPKVPARIECVEQLPRTASGKLIRRPEARLDSQRRGSEIGTPNGRLVDVPKRTW